MDPTASAELLSAAMAARVMRARWAREDAALREIFASVSSEMDDAPRMF